VLKDYMSNKYIFSSPIKKDQFILFIEFMLERGHNEYEEALKILFNRSRLPSLNDDNMIEQAIPKSINDANRKIKNKNYYISNALCFLDISKMLCNDIQGKIDFIDTLENDNIYIYNYHYLFRCLYFDSIELLRIFEENILNIESQFTLWKASFQHTLTIYQFLKQTIFGQQSFHSNIGREIDMSILVIRQMIELRIRRAIGLLGLFNKEDDSVEPLRMDIILDAINVVINKYNNIINLSVPIHNLKRIYSWANIFTHSGIKAFSWLPIKCCFI